MVKKNKQLYFLDRDSSSHWYLVPANKRKQWNAWTDLDEDDERSWDAPQWATRIGCSPTCIEFLLLEETTDKESTRNGKV
jgi:hypothetical protein